MSTTTFIDISTVACLGLRCLDWEYCAGFQASNPFQKLAGHIRAKNGHGSAKDFYWGLLPLLLLPPCLFCLARGKWYHPPRSLNGCGISQTP